MEDNIRSETPLLAAADAGSAIQLNWSSWNASSLTAENRKDVLRCSMDETPNDSTTWTEQKHIMYLNQLEASFVEQLHQSKSSYAQCSRENQRDKNISQKWPSFEQFTVVQNGSWENVNYERAKLLSRKAADSCNLLKSPWISRLSRTGVQNPVPSEAMKLNADIYEEGTMSHGVAKCSHEFSASNPYDDEGTGQNFFDEGIWNKTKIEFQEKRLKTGLTDSSSRDQIVPKSFNSSLYPPT